MSGFILSARNIFKANELVEDALIDLFYQMPVGTTSALVCTPPKTQWSAPPLPAPLLPLHSEESVVIAARYVFIMP
jgi:hypothetical protein